jgi:hypothetical protein
LLPGQHEENPIVGRYFQQQGMVAVPIDNQVAAPDGVQRMGRRDVAAAEQLAADQGPAALMTRSKASVWWSAKMNLAFCRDMLDGAVFLQVDAGFAALMGDPQTQFAIIHLAVVIKVATEQAVAFERGGLFKDFLRAQPDGFGKPGMAGQKIVCRKAQPKQPARPAVAAIDGQQYRQRVGQMGRAGQPVVALFQRFANQADLPGFKVAQAGSVFQRQEMVLPSRAER